MKKALDAAAIVALAFVCLSGVVLHNSPLPAGAAMITAFGALNPLLFGLSQLEWTSINHQAEVLFLVLLLPNLFWGWGALCWIVRRGERGGSFSRAFLGVISGVTLIALLISSMRFGHGVVPVLPDEAVPLLGGQSDERIGALSLDKIEHETGVPSEYMRANLGLPLGVDQTAPLSSLMPRYRFTAEGVRSVIIMHRMGKTLPVPSITPPPRPH